MKTAKSYIENRKQRFLNSPKNKDSQIQEKKKTEKKNKTKTVIKQTCEKYKKENKK